MTRFNNKYPYTDFHELNADWLLETVEEAADEANSMDDRVTSLESGMRDVASTVSDLSSGVGRLSAAVTTLDNEINAEGTGIKDYLDDTRAIAASNTNRIAYLEGKDITYGYQIGNLAYSLADPFRAASSYSTGDYVINEDTKRLFKAIVDIPAGTGDIDDLTQFEPVAITNEMGGAGQSDAVLYLEFDSSLIGVDDSSAWDSRIAYDYLKNFIPLNTSGEESEVVKLYDSNTNRVFTLNQFHKQDSANPNGSLTFTCRVPYYSGGDLKYYSNYGVVVAQSGTYPTYSETKEYPLPEVSVADAGSFLAVDENGEWGLDTPSVPVGSPISATNNLGGITILYNSSTYDDNYINIEIVARTTVARTDANVIVMNGMLDFDYSDPQPITIDLIDSTSYAPITGGCGTLKPNSTSNAYISITCSGACDFRVSGRFRRD